MEFKFDLKQLGAMFARSVADESLPLAQQSFAAKLVALCMHMQRIEAQSVARTNALGKQMDSHVSELATHILEARVATLPQSAPPSRPETVDAQTQQPGEESEDDQVKAMTDQVLADTAAEEAATAKNITPLRAPSSGKAQPAGGAA